MDTPLKAHCQLPAKTKTKHFFLGLLICLITTSSIFGQYPSHQLVQYPDEWNSSWITHPDIDKTAYGLIHFRNELVLKEVPEEFIIHISGDNRYRLYVNGTEVVYGPQLGDLRHWRYETIDLSPFLRTGNNILAVEVMNWGVERSYGIISFKTGLLIQGHSQNEYLINSGSEGNWKVTVNEGIFEKTVFWRGGGEIVGGFYAANPTDSIVAASYPWGWKELAFDDSAWKTPEVIFSRPKTKAGFGHGWILQPRTTALQTNSKQQLTNVVRTDIPGTSLNTKFGAEVITVPPNSNHSLLIDQGYVTSGYPKLQMSGGKNALIKVKYSEALYDANNQKGHRNEINGKVIKGISDVYLMDGGQSRVFQPIWFRAFRFIQIDIETQDQPLVLEDFHNVYSAVSMPAKARFSTNAEVYQDVWNLCQHGLELCAQDNLLSDLYYEQMQYVGDLRPHLMAWTTLTGDLTYFKSAMEQFNNSRLPDGNITSCYPLKATFVHPTYSLMWIDMLHDLMMWEGDKKVLSSYTGEILEVFDYYESLINQHGLVGKSDYYMFIDWYLPKGGNSRVNKEGNSAILTLNYAYTLKKAADILEWLGDPDKAVFYRAQSKKYALIVRSLCFDSERGIYADDPEKTFYDQRASILAVLCGAHTEIESQEIMELVLNDQTQFDSKANLFYYLYLFEAMAETGVGDFTEVLEPWKDIVNAGLTATPEKRIEQHPRSEVHPWTAHPLYFYFRTVAGIRPTMPGYHEINIAPNPGNLKYIRGSYPTIKGMIDFDLSFKKDATIKGTINLPETISGKFEWKGKTTELMGGKNTW